MCRSDVRFIYQLSKMSCEREKQLYLEKAYDGVARKGVWDAMKMYGVKGHFLETVKSCCEGSEEHVREWVIQKAGCPR